MMGFWGSGASSLEIELGGMELGGESAERGVKLGSKPA